MRPPGTVGTDESVLRATLPATPAHPADETDEADHAAPVRDRPRAPAPDATPTPAEAADPWTAARSADDSDRGWGREEPSSNDDRLRRERPPHW